MKNTRINLQLISDLMYDQRYTVAKLSDAIGMDASTIRIWLSGRSVPSALNLKKVCDVLGVPVDDVFTEDAVLEKVAA